MAPADVAVVAIIGLYAFFGLFHGFVVSMLRLASLVAMFLVLTVYAEPLARALPFVQAVSLSDEMAFLIVVGVSFIAIMAFTGIVTFFVKAVPATGASRLLGGVLGVLRASLFLVLAVIVSSLMPRSWTHGYWQQSTLLRMYGTAAEIALTVVPATGPGGEPTQLSRIEFDPDTRQPSLPRLTGTGVETDDSDNPPGIRDLESFIPADSDRLRDLESFIPPADEDPLEAIKIFSNPNDEEGDGDISLSDLTQSGNPDEVQKQLEEMREIPLEDLWPAAMQALERVLGTRQQQPQP